MSRFSPRSVLVTGGAGFIGSHFIRHVLAANPDVNIVNLDALTYAGSRANLEGFVDSSRHQFIVGTICDQSLVHSLLRQYDIDTVVHFAAESHVDRSIAGPDAFIRTNVQGTFTLLEEARKIWLEENSWGHRQLWSVSTPREVYAHGDSFVPQSSTHSSLWRRIERARLAVCRGSLCGGLASC